MTRFGAFDFDHGSGQLRRDGVRVPLQRQPGRLLELLLTKPGEVVTRDEIRHALWGDGTHVDFERSLNFCVAKLRAALDDDASAPRFVETIPTRGYRFIGAAETAERGATDYTEDTDTKVTEDTDTAAADYADRAGWFAAAVAGILLVAAFGLYSYRHSSPGMPKIVVVPFHNETGLADFDRIAKGVSDAAVAQLAAPDRLSRLLVIGNAANLQFSFKPRDMKAVGNALGAQYLLLGQLKKDAQRMRIVAHLIRVSDQTHLWAKTYDTDVLDLPQQAAIAEQIAASIVQRLPKG